MMPSKSVLLVLVCLACATQEETVCIHPARGDTKPVSLETVAKAQQEIQQRLAMTWDKSTKLSTEMPFDSGLPGCKARQTRRVRTTVPPDLVGKTIAFAPADRIPPADVRVATSGRKIIDIEADALADRALVDRLGVRCAPTLVRAISEVELELLENP
jgi:hypothetical protein